MVLSHLSDLSFAHGADEPRWDAAASEPNPHMEYQGLGIFRPHAPAPSNFLYDDVHRGSMNCQNAGNASAGDFLGDGTQMPIQLAQLSRNSGIQNVAHSYSYTDNSINGQFTSREVATRCVDGTCHRTLQDVFPTAATGEAAPEVAATVGEQDTPWFLISRSKGNRFGKALNSALGDVSQLLSNVYQEQCGGRRHNVMPSGRSFSHGYFVSNNNGQPDVNEIETHCRNGNCVRYGRHLTPVEIALPVPQDESPMEEESPMEADPGPPIHAGVQSTVEDPGPYPANPSDVQALMDEYDEGPPVFAASHQEAPDEAPDFRESGLTQATIS